MLIKDGRIDGGNAFDWGKTSADYAKFRDIYPRAFYEKIISRGLCADGQKILDLGTGTGVLPRNMYKYGGKWTGTDISEEQINQAKALSEGMDTVFTSIPYDAGWIVTVDGERVETFCIADALLGFASTPGEHTVVMKYRPDCVKYGLILSAVGIVAYAGLSFWDWRRRDYIG